MKGLNLALTHQAHNINNVGTEDKEPTILESGESRCEASEEAMSNKVKTTLDDAVETSPHNAATCEFQCVKKEAS